jgi:phytoene dehydrogenase-like protein
MTKTFDIVVAGAGHNSLTTAAYLAKAGLKVLVLERQDWVGGGVLSKELTAPGFVHDPHSVSHGVIQANPLITNDELGLLSKYGLKYVYPEASVATVFDDHSVLMTWFDVDKTCESMAKISAHDAEAYRRLAAKMREMLPMFVQGMFAPPLPFGSFLGMLEQSREGRELIGVMNQSAFDLINDIFQSDKVKIHLMKYASEHMVGPEEKGTGLVFFLMVGFLHRYCAGLPVGGSGELSASLVRCIMDLGGEVLTGRDVSKVVIQGGKAVAVQTIEGEDFRARRAIIGSFHPHVLADYVEGLDPRLIRDAKKTQPGSYSALVVNYALNANPMFHGMDGLPPPLLVECLTSNLETMRQEFDFLRYGRMPKHASLVVAAHANHDPSRAPPGKGTLYLYNFAPYQLADGLTWEAEKERHADWMMAEFRKFTTNMGADNIIARHVASPLEMERGSPSFRRGDIMGIGQYLYQFLGRRPTPELAQYAVPGAENLYLAGPFMHPGGGVTGGGRCVAAKIMSDLNIDFDKAISR